MFDIVCYLGGTGGDLITAMIDGRGAKIQNNFVTIDQQRQRLKKSWQFENDQDRNIYLSKIQTQYKSIPSHDTDYHLRNNHRFIAIVVKDKSVALWASQRFKNLHLNKVWHEMQSVNNANTVEKYAQDMLDWSSWIQQHTKYTIALEDILNGCVDRHVSSIITLDAAGIDFYKQWLKAQHENSNYSNPG